MLEITNMVAVTLHLINIRYVGFDILGALDMKSSIFWNIMA
jgi:hypothetical protein